jgi:hypothetical protein
MAETSELQTIIVACANCKNDIHTPAGRRIICLHCGFDYGHLLNMPVKLTIDPDRIIDGPTEYSLTYALNLITECLAT